MVDDDSPESLPNDGEQHTFETEYTGRPPSIAVVETIAAIEGVASNDVEFTLFESLDPDALDTLFDEQTETTEQEDDVVAEFKVNDYTVEITSSGKLTVNAPAGVE